MGDKFMAAAAGVFLSKEARDKALESVGKAIDTVKKEFDVLKEKIDKGGEALTSEVVGELRDKAIENVAKRTAGEVAAKAVGHAFTAVTFFEADETGPDDTFEGKKENRRRDTGYHSSKTEYGNTRSYGRA